MEEMEVDSLRRAQRYGSATPMLLATTHLRRLCLSLSSTMGNPSTRGSPGKPRSENQEDHWKPWEIGIWERERCSDLCFDRMSFNFDFWRKAEIDLYIRPWDTLWMAKNEEEPIENSTRTFRLRNDNTYQIGRVSRISLPSAARVWFLYTGVSSFVCTS